MTKTFILPALLFLFSLNVSSQAPGWQFVSSTGNSTYYEDGVSIAVDLSGNIYTLGEFQGTLDFDPGPGVFNLTATLGIEHFLTKYDPAGNLIWAINTGGRFGNIGDLVMDSLYNIYIVSAFTGTSDFDPGPGVFNMTAAGASDIYVSKLDSSGNLIWAKSMGGPLTEYAYSIALEYSTGSIYVAGGFFGTADFDPGAGVYSLTAAGQCDGYICRLDANGNLFWAVVTGGADFDLIDEIVSDSKSNDIYVTGRFMGTVDFDPGPATVYMTSNGNNDIYVSKLDTWGQFLWVKRMGDADADWPSAMRYDPSGNGALLVTGSFRLTVDFDPGPATYNLTALNDYDVFVMKLDTSGALIWAKGMGGAQEDVANGMAVDPASNVYVTGYFVLLADFDPGPGVFELHGGSIDIFVAKLDSSGNFLWAKSAGGSASMDVGYSIAADASDHAFVTGVFQSRTALFDSTLLINSDTSGTTWDLFIAKLGTCMADYSLYQDTVPHSWIALNQATGVSPLTYTWSWGDSTTSTGASPTHVYNNPGYYSICLSVTDAVGCSSTYCMDSAYLFRPHPSSVMVTITVLNIPTGIQDPLSTQKAFSIYPNPSNGQLRIDLPNSSRKIEVINSAGQVIQTLNVAGLSNQQLEIRSPGFYSIRITTDKEMLIQKLVIQE